MNFSLMQHHKWDIDKLENMIPWEREIYIQMLIAHIEKEKEKKNNQR